MVLFSNNPQHCNSINRYGKAKAILQLINHFPNISAFKELVLFTEVSDLQNYLPQLSGDFIYRQDQLIGSEHLNNIKKSGSMQDIVSYFKALKQQSDQNVLLVLSTNFQNLPRYISNGGFSVLINKGQNAIIEVVGKGFDAKELTNGLAVHEIYEIPFNEVLFCDSVIKLNNYLVKTCTQDEYNIQYQNRKDYLLGLTYLENDIKNYLQEQYSPVSNNVKSQLVNEVLFVLFEKMVVEEFESSSYWVCGNISDTDQIIPFEFSSVERIYSK